MLFLYKSLDPTQRSVRVKFSYARLFKVIVKNSEDSLPLTSLLLIAIISNTIDLLTVQGIGLHLEEPKAVFMVEPEQEG